MSLPALQQRTGALLSNGDEPGKWQDNGSLLTKAPNRSSATMVSPKLRSEQNIPLGTAPPACAKPGPSVQI